MYAFPLKLDHFSVQEGLRAEHHQQLQEAHEKNDATITEAQAQIAMLSASKQKLLEEFGQRTKDWRTDRENSEVINYTLDVSIMACVS